MKNYAHKFGFALIVLNAIEKHGPTPKFCNPEIGIYLRNFFVKSRIFQSLKFLNEQLQDKKCNLDKIKIITNM